MWLPLRQLDRHLKRHLDRIGTELARNSTGRPGAAWAKGLRDGLDGLHGLDGVTARLTA